MKRKIVEIDGDSNTQEKQQKNNNKSIVAFECNCDMFCYPCNDSTIRSITLLVSTAGKKQSYQFSTYETNFTEKDILEKSLDVLKKLESFKLIGYGIALFDLELIASKCDKYELEYKYLFKENTIDLHKEISKHIKLQRYRLEDVTKKILDKEFVPIIDDKSIDKNAHKHCEIYLELAEALNMMTL